MKPHLPAIRSRGIVLSPYDEDFGGFQIVTNQNGITVPDKLVLANWKRLNDSSWDYSASSNRNFNNLPYSINDSGIALYYDGKTIPPDGKMEITMAMGKYSPNGYNMSRNIGSSELTDVFDSSLKNTPEDGGDVVLSVETDLITINDFINRVNKRLERGEEITDEEMEILNQVIQELSERKQLYEGD